MLPRNQERITNLNFIYNTSDVKVVQMLRISRSPFYELVKRFRERGLL
jgi:transposase